VSTTAARGGGIVSDSSPAKPARRRAPGAVFVGAFATIALAVAVGSSIVTGNATSRENARLRSEIGSLKRQMAATNRVVDATARNLAATTRSLASARASLKADGAELALLRTSTDARNLWGSVSELRRSVGTLSVCVAALQRELGPRKARPLSSPCASGLVGH
jgi:septal ring factor EnvC (AmiA/AmiB activator)